MNLHRVFLFDNLSIKEDLTDGTLRCTVQILWQKLGSQQ